jgi:hypothetical protein
MINTKFSQPHQRERESSSVVVGHLRVIAVVQSPIFGDESDGD